MRIETKYICDYCEFKHKTLKEVTDCETSCKEKIKKFDVIKMFKVCNSLNCKINFLKNTIKKRRSIYNGVANT